ncbi:MAG: hypothetical protein Q9191_004230 [Dirinaria sp. TL-2023a]
MDVVSGVASVSQLIAYGHVLVQRLVQLYKAAREGPSCCQTQRFNIRFLLELVQRICTDEAPNTEAILSLLIATVNLANSLLKLLQPKGTWYNYWLLVSKGQEIKSTFSALNDKTRLLQLHITERTYDIVTHVQNDIKQMNQGIKRQPTSNVDQSPSTSIPQIMSTSTQDTQTAQAAMNSGSTPNARPNETVQGHVRITSNGNVAKSNAKQSIANGWGESMISATINSCNNTAEGYQNVANWDASSYKDGNPQN